MSTVGKLEIKFNYNEKNQKQTQTQKQKQKQTTKLKNTQNIAPSACNAAIARQYACMVTSKRASEKKEKRFFF